MTPIAWMHSREMVEAVIWLEAKAIGVMLIYTVCLMIARRHIEAAEERYKEFYGGLLTDELIETGSTAIRMPSWRHPIRRRVLQQVMLSHLDFLTGGERQKIIQMYLRLGYVAVDLKMSHSIFWWKRLEAVTNLRQLEITELAPIMDRMRQDQNPFVMMAALVALSGTDHPLNSAAILENLPHSVLERNNVMLEVVTNLGRLRGYNSLVEYLGYRHPLKLNEACIAAITSSTTSENAAIVVTLLEDRLPKEIILRIIGFLQKVGDPDHAKYMMPYLEHQDPAVRSEAARWLLTVGDPDDVHVNQMLRNDPSAEVRRILNMHVERGAA